MIFVMAFEYQNPCNWVPEVSGFVAYALKLTNGDIYKGFTSNFKQRMCQHWNGMGGGTTSWNKPLYILHYEVFTTKREAMDKEAFFKSYEGRQFLIGKGPFKSIRP